MRRDSGVAVGLAILFLLAVAALAAAGLLSFIVLYVYLGVSACTFVAYARDKSAARSGEWRTPEMTLHMLALFCGWPGALAAQSVLRHKSSKRSFLVIFWLTAAMNLAVLVVTLSDPFSLLPHK